ncbi:hypothetical protein AQUCO_00800070v1 [Aquilegia coerulea]|uniref:Uncharacterized protein n=1 Tax=Aquilegia coerulea TaxID=218851 RepID=A0A2G5EHA4_AQUCA|nr:hypothetical protein AQUCO_05800205v1 [Aquilegia coerulea]PIA55071.1 hypothetical protein AQUCO_00800070v1 [Aquilegia coerulea]
MKNAAASANKEADLRIGKSLIARGKVAQALEHYMTVGVEKKGKADWSFYDSCTTTTTTAVEEQEEKEEEEDI